MNHPQNAFACDRSRINSFLSEELGVTEEALFVEHLNDCDNCRAALSSAAAERESWHEADLFLKDDRYDRVLLSSHAGIPEDVASDTVSAQISSVLNVLAPTDDPKMLGRLGSYEVSGVIGAGGMGVVLKAHDPSLDRTVAIKVLAPHLASSGAARRRFAREAKAAAAVLHPNVIAIHGVSNSAALPYLVMPYIRGESLQRRLDQQGTLETEETLRIGQQIAAGLVAAHALGLVHRDIKPANILLEDGVERVTITDFGLARAVDDATMTRSGVIAGTPQYMSPEQARGEAIDVRSDLFSLGSLLYAMCTGRPPFRAETSFGVLRRITDDAPRNIREINSETPAWLCRLITRLQTKDRRARIQSAAEVERLLHQCIAHFEQPSTQSLPERLLEPPSHNGLGWIVGLAALLLMTIGLTASVHWIGRNDSSQPPSTAGASGKALPQQQPEHSLPATSPAQLFWDDGTSVSLDELDRSLQQLEQSTENFFD